MKLNCKEELFDFQGKKIGVMGERLSEILGFSRTKKNPIKLYELGLKCQNQAEIDLDESDINLIEEEVKEAEATPVLTGQILLKIKEQRRAQEAKEDKADTKDKDPAA